MDIKLGKVRISGAALLALSAVYFFDFGGFTAAVAVALAVHELGHLVAMRFFGCSISEFGIDIWGLNIRYNKPMSYRQEIVTAAAGPAASLLLAFAASFLGRYAGSEGAYIVAGVSLVFFVFNLLPIMMLDGGKILYDAVALALGLERAEKIICITSCAVIGALMTGGVALLIWTRLNFTLLLTAVWMLFSYCKRTVVRVKLREKNVGSV